MVSKIKFHNIGEEIMRAVASGVIGRMRLALCFARRRLRVPPYAPLLLLVLGFAAYNTSALYALEITWTRLDVTEFPQITAYLRVADKGDAVVGLAASDFEVMEDESPIRPFSISAVFQGDQYLTAVVVTDLSGSMKGDVWNSAQVAIRGFLDRVSVKDRLALVIFRERVELVMPFSSDVEPLVAMLKPLKPRGNTALNDALLVALRLYTAENSRRRGIIVLSDGKDTSSRAGPETVVKALASSGIPVYAIALGKNADAELLRRYVKVSNGAYYSALNPNDLRLIYERIAGPLQNEYRIRYQTALPQSMSWHLLSVTAHVDRATVSATRRFLAHPRPASAGVSRPHGFAAQTWIASVIGAFAGFLMALGYSIVLRRMDIRPWPIYAAVFVLGTGLGFGLGALVGVVAI